MAASQTSMMDYHPRINEGFKLKIICVVPMNRKIILPLLVILLVPFGLASADSQEKLDFAAGLEETLWHFWAPEQNLDEGNAQLALVHATHPIAGLYDAIKPTPAASDPALDSRVLREMIKSGAPASKVDAQIDSVLKEIDGVAVVPEFGVVAVILAVAIAGIIIAARSRPGLISNHVESRV